MTAIRIRNLSGDMVAGVEIDDTKPLDVRLLLPAGAYEAVLFADGDTESHTVPFEVGEDGGQNLVGRSVEGSYMINVANIAFSYGGRRW